MRAPALLVSPWVSKGKVIHDPVGPTPTSKYEHSSMLSALKTIFDLPSYLTRRDAWAGDFSSELDLNEPRTDCPMHMPAPPTESAPQSANPRPAKHPHTLLLL
jgi:phospholipase C